MARLTAIVTGLLLILQATAGAAAAGDAPPVLLIQAAGDVAYSTDGQTWRKVRRNKFLHRGYTVRTGPDGRCKLLDQETDRIRTVEPGTVVKIGEKGLTVLKGQVSKAAPAGGVAAFLERKFTRVQKYAAVQRSPKNRTPKQFKTARRVVLSKEYPDLVWENQGPLYSYELAIGERRFKVPPSKEEIIRFAPPAILPGVYPYRVKILYQGEVLQAQKQDGELRWLSDEEVEAFHRKTVRIEALTAEDGFLLANLMDDEGLKVAAMDTYRRYMAENPDANEVRPFLIKVLSDLHLEQMRRQESVRYHRLQDQEK
ncbi:hypothetical protein [Desulfococcus sp.]|uniref:DUF7354 domain-containing protein n=1 Tax=Desulfococcus sp. TaxID=2025834 RepID=UPI003594739E